MPTKPKAAEADAPEELVSVYPMDGPTAKALLAAADKLGLDPGVVETTSYDGFRVPASVRDAADLPKAEPTPEAEAPAPADDATKE